MSEIKNGRLGLYGAEHSKCDHMMTLGFKGLTYEVGVSATTNKIHGKGNCIEFSSEHADIVW